MCFSSGLCSFPSGSVGGASRCASSVDWERGTRRKDDKAPFEACKQARATPLLLPHQTAARAKSTLEVQPRNTSVCPPVDFTSLRDLRVVAMVTVFFQGYKKV